MDSHLGAADIARLLGISRPRVWQLRKRPDFPEPAGREGGREYWHENAVLRWAAAAGRELAQRAPLLYRVPASSHEVYYLGARSTEGYVVLSWDTTAGAACLFYTASYRVPDPTRRRAPDLLTLAPDAGVIVAHGSLYDAYGPELTAVDRAVPDRSYHPRWADLARILGGPVPYWPMALRKPDEMIRWRPGDPPQPIEATHELDTAPLLRLAANSGDNTTETQAALHLARTIHHRAATNARSDIEILDGAHDRKAIQLAATPVEVSKPPDTPEDVRRAGWAQILDRTDNVAGECARLALQWNSGADFPFATTAAIRPRPGTVAGEWAATLAPAAKRTAAYTVIGDRGPVKRFLIDPATDLPAVETENGTIYAAVSQRLPALAPLTKLILADHVVWIRTADGGLYIAPEQPGRGVSWGYPGGGPFALAILLNRLLDDINAVAPGYGIEDGAPPPGLDALTENAPKEGAIYTRAQLLAARNAQA